MLVDTSVWIDYFRSGDDSQELDYLIDENLVVTNELILAELLPFIIILREKELARILEKIKKIDLKINWDEIVAYQVQCLKSGSNGIGIPDLIIAQNSLQNNLPIYTIDKHFRHC